MTPDQHRIESDIFQAQYLDNTLQFAHGVASHFNRLLTVVVGYSDLVLRRLDKSDPIYEDVEKIRQAGDRAARLTHHLAQFSRYQDLNLSRINLNDLIKNMSRTLKRSIGNRIELIINRAPGFCWVMGDAERLKQVIGHLVSNACDAMPSGGTLTIETRNVEYASISSAGCEGPEVGSYVMLGVSDTGIGMDAATRVRIFEPFFTTKSNSRMGLGLTTVYAIVKRSNGYIRVSSAVGEGSSFMIYLPRTSR